MSSGGLYGHDLGTWLEAALALPDRLVPLHPALRPAREFGQPGCVVIPVLAPALEASGLVTAAPIQPHLGAARARVYRTTDPPEAGGPRWYWHCPRCDMGGGHNCKHDLLHPPGSWTSAMCGAFHHVHTRHPRPGVPQDERFHTILGGRRRCDWSTPTAQQRAFAAYVLCGRTGYPRGELARTVAREVLSLAGIRPPG